MTTFLEYYKDLRQMVTWNDVAIYGIIIFVTWITHKLFIAPMISPLRKVPGPQYYPLVGNMLEVIKHSGGTNTIRWMQKYKSRIIRYYAFGGEGRILVGDPAVVKHVLGTNSNSYTRFSGSSGVVNPYSILALSGQEHRSLRKICNPAFSSASVKNMFSVFNEKSIKLCNLWDKMLKNVGAEGIPAADTLTRMTLEVMCKCALNQDFDALENPNQLGLPKIRGLFEFARPSRLQALPFSRYLPLKVNMEQKENQKYFQGLVSSVIQKGREKGTLDENKFQDLLSLLLLVRDEDGNPMSDKVLSAQVGTFFLAGHETTGVSLAFICHLLTTHPEIQERARKEVLSVLPDSNMPLTLQSLDKMEYLTRVIKEALRFYPPVSSVFRSSKKDDVIEGYKIPANTLIGISISALHKLPENWENPEEFNPDRFLEDESNLLYKYLPFGVGAMKCIGYRFALLEIKTTLSVILRHFQLSGIPGYNPKILTGITNRLHPPLHLNLKRID